MYIDRVRLKGELWVLTTYFNPLGLKIKKRNFELFAKNLKRQGARLALIENTAEGGTSDLAESSADIYIRCEGGSVLWQKERLMNILEAMLPPEADRIVFCDCDILFQDDDWLKKTADLLEDYRVVQPFSHYIRLERDKTAPEEWPPQKGMGPGQIFHSFALGYNCYKTGDLKQETIGIPGFSWAFRRSVLRECPLYEHMIVGGGDTAMAYAYAGTHRRNPLIHKMTAAHRESYLTWGDRAQKAVKASLGLLSGTIFHLWHGDPLNRRYTDRHDILLQQNFDPATDIRTEPGRPLYWASDKHLLHKGVADYFASRREEG